MKANKTPQTLASKVQSGMTTRPQGPAHLIIKALAGTGKTTTGIEGLSVLKGKAPRITPSSQQRAIWDALLLSKGAQTIAYVAFNRSIAEELKSRVPVGVDAMTMHSMGLKAVTKAFGRLEISSYVVQDLIAELTETDIRTLRRDQPILLSATEDLVRMCKMNLCDPTVDALDALCSRYDIDCNHSKDEVYALVPKILERCKDPVAQGRINFDDMIWLPVALNLPVFKYDLLIVDEAQDLNRCQQELAKMAGRRLVFCGDEHQAIYGFAGADSKAMNRLESELRATPQGCEVLPLTMTRRCGKAIVKAAQSYVPEFEAAPSCCGGKVSEALYSVQRRDGADVQLPWDQTYAPLVCSGDMVIARVNAPLVRECFRFIGRGIKAQMLGRDLAKGLTTLVSKAQKAGATTLLKMMDWVEEWLTSEVMKEQAKKNPNDNRILSLNDRVDCLFVFCEDSRTCEEVLAKIDRMFTDDKAAPGVKFASIHKSKGLEARRVFFICNRYAPCPHPMAKSDWERGQEHNLKYVGITRAIEELVWVR